MIRVFPVGAIFNGQKKYTLEAVTKIVNNPITPFDRKIIGYQTILQPRVTGSERWFVRANFDTHINSTASDSKFSLGMGRYKIEFYKDSNDPHSENPEDYTELDSYCYLDWSDVRLYTGNQGNVGTIDIHFSFFSYGDLRFHWRSNSNYYSVSLINNDLKIWEQYGSGYSSSAQVKGPFLSDDSQQAFYLNYPIDARDSGAVDHLYHDIRNHIATVIEEYEYNSSVIEKAYSYYIMCLTKEGFYNEAKAGYENIIENHPEATRRLAASWDRSAIVLFQQGSGGGDNISELQFKNKLFKDKPAHQIAKNVFLKLKNNSDKNSNIPVEKIRKINSRISRFDPESRIELDKKISEDVNILFGISTEDKINNQIIPDNFELSQNYPNPFNPNTVISYQLPVDGIVSLKVYNVLGKEVTTLVDEGKSAGLYKVTFDGSNLPSGIYFYKLEAGNFTSIKKMILIK